MVKTKKDTKARVAERRKQTQNIQMDLNVRRLISIGINSGVTINITVIASLESLASSVRGEKFKRERKKKLGPPLTAPGSLRILLSLSSFRIFKENFCSLDLIFLLTWYDSCSFIRKATFTSSPRVVFSFVRSSLFSLFRTGPRNFFVVRVYLKLNKITPEAYHLEASNFPYRFETMLPIIPDQWKSLFKFLPI